MSLLPQNKKSAAEITRLRESLGIPAQAPAEQPVAQENPEMPGPPIAISPAVANELQNPVAPAPAALAPIPVEDPRQPKVVRSLRRSERIPILPVELDGPPPAHPHPPEDKFLPAKSPLPVAPGIKPVRSLRKSEHHPSQVSNPTPPPPDSNLPQQRHNDDELQRIRKLEAISLIAADTAPPRLTAHLAMVIAGYLFAIAGGVGYYFYELRIEITAACVVGALLVAGFTFFCRPLSRHHAAFIAVIALFVTVFGSLYYFPQLSFQPTHEEKAELPNPHGEH